MPARGKTHLKPALEDTTNAGTESRTRTPKKFRGTRLPVDLDQEIEFLADVYGTTVTAIVEKGLSEFIARTRQDEDFKARLERRNAERAAIAERLQNREI